MTSSNSSMPPEMEAFLNNEKLKQKSHVQVAEAKRNVKETIGVIQDSLLPKLCERGTQLDQVVVQADELEQSSTDFLSATQPSWRQWLRTWKPPLWWWPSWMLRWCQPCCNLCYNRKQRKRNLQFH